MYTLYSMRRSGNCYKVRLALAQLDIPHELVEIDILKGETRTPEFLSDESERPRAAAGGGARPLHRRIQRHPLVHRRRHAAVPEDRVERAEMLQWMFFEQHASSPISAPPISGWPWSRAGASCSSTRWKTGWRKAIARSA